MTIKEAMKISDREKGFNTSDIELIEALDTLADEVKRLQNKLEDVEYELYLCEQKHEN